METALLSTRPFIVRTIERAPVAPETIVAATAMLAAYGIALALEHIGHGGAGLSVQAVVLALTMARGNRRSSSLPAPATVAVVALVALCAVQIGGLLERSPDAGDVLFVAGVSAPIWVRRFGPRATMAGAYATLPFVGLLMVPAPAREGHPSALWAAAIAVVACLCAMAADRAAVAAGLLRPPAARVDHRPARTGGTWRRPLASTRMAIHMALAVGAAFVLGRVLFGPQHWAWVVLSAFIVCSGARGRANVAHKAVLRLAGAAVGTVGATLLAGLAGPGQSWSVVAIFAVLIVALELRRRSYAFWAVGVTTVLALLYGYFGQGGADLLGTRLLGVLLGATLGALASWLVLPVRTRDVALVRLAAGLRALGDVLEHPGDAEARARLRHTVAEVDEIARPFELQRLVVRGRHHPIPEAIDALRRCELEGGSERDVGTLRATVTALARERREG